MARTQVIHLSQGDDRSTLRTTVAVTACVLMVLTSLAIAASDARGQTPEVLLGRNRVGEFQPVRGNDYLAWQQNTRKRPRHFDVYARPLQGGNKFKVNAAGTQGANGSIDGAVLVYQQFKGKRSDLKFFDLDTRTRTAPPAGVNTGRWEYWPSFSGNWLLFARLYPNESRAIILFDLSTGDSSRLDRVRGRGSSLAPGQVSGDWATWSKCRKRSCDVIRYHISDGTRETIPNSNDRQHAPSVAPDGTVFFARSNARCGGNVRLIRDPLQGAETVLWRISSGDDIGTTRTFVDPNGVTTVLFDQFDCDQAAGSDAWAMGEDFAPALTVTLQGNAGGTVTSSPPGIDCGNDCTETYDLGTGVTLTAQPEQGVTFAGWSGACTGTGVTCNLTMNGPRAVTATFTSKPVLTVSKSGTGGGTVTSTPGGINCGSDCQEPYDEGTTVTLTAAPDQGSSFGGWSGPGACGMALTCQVTMNGDRSVTATFDVEQTFTLTVTTTGTGSGTVSGDGISCPGDCTETYSSGTQVSLSASPDALSTFSGWGGDCTGTGSCALTMDGNHSVTATFDLLP